MLDSIWTDTSALLRTAGTCVLTVIFTLWIQQKWKDRSKRKASRQDVQELREHMPDLIDALQKQLRETPLKWDFQIMDKHHAAARPKGIAVYLTDGSDGLADGVDNLLNHQYISRTGFPPHCNRYRMSRTFVTLLKTGGKGN